MSLILCIETGTDICSVGIARDGELMSLRESDQGRDHAKQVAVFVDELLRETGVKPDELDAVAVGMGPGSYTGLRIGVSFAKGLCYGLNIPLLAVGSLEALTDVAIKDYEAGIIQVEGWDEALLCPMVDARRMEVYTQIFNSRCEAQSEVSAEIITEGKVYWEDFRVESTPQLAASVGLNYRSNNNWFLSLDWNYYDDMYLSMSPVYRTDAVISAGMSDADIANIRRQEKFDSAYVLNASIGKNWSIQRKYTLGFSLSIDNLLNDQDIKTGGYEQTRLVKNEETTVTTYQPFDSKYFYMFGTTYYLNVYFRF